MSRINMGRIRARAATTSNCCAARTSWTNCARSPGRSGSISTRSPCPGRTKGSGSCRRTSTSISWRACASSKPASNRESRAFFGVYPQYIEQVRPELNGLFREEDYPSAEKLRTKFGVKLEVLPIPSGADFRVQMSAEEQARVSREIDANVRESLTRGTEDLWRRVREVVAHMVDRLNEPESRFHGSLVTNVLDIVEILPRLNVNGDADLNRFAEQIKQRLCNYSAQDLKKHDLLRVTTAADAANIVAEMDDVLRGREAAETADWPDRRRHLHPHVRVHGGARGGMRIETPTSRRIQKARTALVLDHPFFGSLLFRLKGRECRSIQTMATDGVSLYYNPEFVETLNAATLAGTLAHEVMHPALHHHVRRSGRDPKRWNMACDFAINPLLVDAGLSLPEGVLLDNRFRGMSAEQIYNLLESEGRARFRQ